MTSESADFAQWLDTYVEDADFGGTTRFVMTQLSPVKIITLEQLVQICKALDGHTQTMIRASLELADSDPVGLFNNIAKSLEL